jgi:hypothetical protein
MIEYQGRKFIWRGLQARGVNEKHVWLIKKCYRKATARVRCKVGTTESFQVKGWFTPGIGPQSTTR